MLNGALGAMVNDIKIEIKAKNFNRKHSFLPLQCIDALFSRIFYHFCILNNCPGSTI
jgi:hypothetical protein